MDFLKNNKKGMKEKRSRKDGVGGGGVISGWEEGDVIAIRPGKVRRLKELLITQLQALVLPHIPGGNTAFRTEMTSETLNRTQCQPPRTFPQGSKLMLLSFANAGVKQCPRQQISPGGRAHKRQGFETQLPPRPVSMLGKGVSLSIQSLIPSVPLKGSCVPRSHIFPAEMTSNK